MTDFSGWPNKALKSLLIAFKGLHWPSEVFAEVVVDGAAVATSLPGTLEQQEGSLLWIRFTFSQPVQLDQPVVGVQYFRLDDLRRRIKLNLVAL